MNIFVTGAGGFVGQWLTRRLLPAGHDVWGLSRTGAEHGTFLTPEAGAIRWEVGDLADEARLHRLLDRVRPRAIYHLAAQSNPHASHQDPAGTFMINVVGTINLLQACRAYAEAGNEPPRVLLIGSGQMYGRVPPEALPLAETTPLDPVSPYGASKAAQELVGRQYWHAYHLPSVMTRSFNQTGPGQDERYSISHFASSLARIGLGLAPPVLSVGNLSSQRDFIDVRDAADAYVALMEHGRPGEAYNVCSGRMASLQEILALLIRLTGLQVEVHVDQQRLRPADEPYLQGSPAKIQGATGWQPRIPLEQTLQDLLDYHRERLSSKIEAAGPA